MVVLGIEVDGEAHIRVPQNSMNGLRCGLALIVLEGTPIEPDLAVEFDWRIRQAGEDLSRNNRSAPHAAIVHALGNRIHTPSPLQFGKQVAISVAAVSRLYGLQGAQARETSFSRLMTALT
jgi:hypothetical protein